MNLIETMIAATILTSSAAGTLQIWSQMHGYLTRDAEVVKKVDVLEAEMIALEAVMRQQKTVDPPTRSCSVVADALLDQFRVLQPPEGVVREISTLQEKSVIRISLNDASESLRRTRQYHLINFGVCNLADATSDGSPLSTSAEAPSP